MNPFSRFKRQKRLPLDHLCGGAIFQQINHKVGQCITLPKLWNGSFVIKEIPVVRDQYSFCWQNHSNDVITQCSLKKMKQKSEFHLLPFKLGFMKQQHKTLKFSLMQLIN